MRLKRLMGIVLVFTCLASATGCAIGFGARTSNQKPAGNGRYATSGDLEIRDATIVADPKDPSKGTLLVTIYNNGSTDDAMINASSDVITSQATNGVLLPSMQAVRVGFNSAVTVALSSASGALVPGTLVPLSLHFANTPSVSMQLLVNTNDGIYAGVKIP